MANKIRLTVGGIDLYVTTDDDEAYMQSIGNEVNQHIKEMTSKNSFLSVTMASVFTALEYCDKAKKTSINTQELHNKIKELSNELACARLESDEARREIERLNKENQTLRAKLSRS